MGVKKKFDFKKWIWIGAIPTTIGAVILSARVITTYADLPEKQKKTEEKVDKIERYIDVQQTANELVQQQLKQQQQSCEQDKQGIWWCWDEEAGEWKPVKKGK